jgi:hypothetical protein
LTVRAGPPRLEPMRPRPVVSSIALATLAAACGPTSPDSGDAGADATAADARVIDAIPIDSPDAPPPPDVEVIITADNAYSFGYGDVGGIATYIQGTRAVTAGQIFNCPIGEGPERHVVPGASAPDTAYLYVVSWDDLAVTQGVLGQFKRGGVPVYTGGIEWDACATGVNLSASTVGPTQAEVNAQIAICHDGSGSDTTTSGGWVNSAGAVTPGAIGNLAVGEANDAATGDFPIVCPAAQGGIDAVARWMWWNPGNVANPFRSTGQNTFRAYLIFRLATVDIPVG